MTNIFLDIITNKKNGASFDDTFLQGSNTMSNLVRKLKPGLKDDKYVKFS